MRVGGEQRVCDACLVCVRPSQTHLRGAVALAKFAVERPELKKLKREESMVVDDRNGAVRFSQRLRDGVKCREAGNEGYQAPRKGCNRRQWPAASPLHMMYREVI